MVIGYRATGNSMFLVFIYVVCCCYVYHVRLGFNFSTLHNDLLAIYSWSELSMCLCLCVCVNQGGPHHNCDTWRFVILHGDMDIPRQFPWTFSLNVSL